MNVDTRASDEPKSEAAPPALAPEARTLLRFGWAIPVVLTLGAYLFTLRYPFIFDDKIDIVDSPRVHHLWPPHWLSLSRRPLVVMTWALNWAWTGSSPWSYRLVNILVHCTSAVLLWACVRQASRSNPEPAERAWTPDALATAIATLWAVHPLHTTAVTYVVHRYESLAGMLMLATLAAWQRANREARYPIWLALTALCAMLAALSKEIAVVAPVLLFAYDRAFSAGSVRSASQRRKGLGLVALAEWGLCALYYPTIAPGASQGAHSGLARMDYLRSEFLVLLHYLRLIVVPWPLSLDYFDWPVSRGWHPTEVLSLLAVAALVSLSLWAWWRRAPRLGWLGLVYFLVLAPTSSIVPLLGELVAERRLYLPLAAVTTLVVVGAQRLARGRGRWLAALTVVTTVALTGVTVSRNRNFRTAVGLFSHDLASRPRNGRLHHLLGESLVSEQGRPLAAWPHYERALELAPGCCPTHERMIVIALGFGWRDVALQQIRAQLTEHQDVRGNWLNYINQLLIAGDDVRARRIAELAAERFPKSPDVFEKLAWVLATAQDEQVVDGARALREAENAMSLSIGTAPPLSRPMTLAAALAAAGQHADALRLVSSLLAREQAAHHEAWVRVLSEQAAAYASGRRWIERNRRTNDAPPAARVEPDGG